MWRFLCMTALVAVFVPGCAEDADPSDIFTNELDFDRDDHNDGALPDGDGELDNIAPGLIPGVDQPTFALEISRVPTYFANEAGGYCMVDFANTGFGTCVVPEQQKIQRLAAGDDMTVLWRRLSAVEKSFCGTIRSWDCKESDKDAWSQDWVDRCFLDLSMDRADRAVTRYVHGNAVIDVVGISHEGDHLIGDKQACTGL